MRRVTYEPISVKDALLEMKNTSQLMIDLAYSAMLYSDSDLAEEVMKLEEKVDDLGYQMRISASLVATTPQDAEKMSGLFVACESMDTISNAAADIANTVLKKVGMHHAIREALGDADETVGRIFVRKGSRVARKTLEQIDLPFLGLDIIALRRGSKWLIDPEDNTVVKEGDQLIMRGSLSGMRSLRILCRDTKRKKKKTVARKVPEELVKLLADLKDNSEVMIDLAYSSLLFNSKELAEEVQNLEESVDSLLEKYLVSVLEINVENKKDLEKETGLLRVAMATELIADAAYEIAETILRGIEPHPVYEMILGEADETVVRTRLRAKSGLAGKTLKELRLPEKLGVMIIGLRRGSKWIFPLSKTRLSPSDILLAKGYEESCRIFKDLASGKRRFSQIAEKLEKLQATFLQPQNIKKLKTRIRKRRRQRT